MFNEFINAYKARYFKVFTSDFKGELARLVNELNDPSLHASDEIKESLNLLIDTLNEPPLIAVIGQFSSGKSTSNFCLMAITKSIALTESISPVDNNSSFADTCFCATCEINAKTSLDTDMVRSFY